MQLTVKDAAKALNVGEKTVYRWIQNGGLPAYRVAGQYRINRAMLFDWASSRHLHFSSEQESAQGDLCVMPTLSTVLRPENIHYKLPGRNKAEVLQNAVGLMELPEQINRDFLYQALLAREQLQSTGIGNGIALPHLRNPEILGLTQAQVYLYFLEAPIDFDAVDGKPVGVLFIPLAPNVRVHLHLLSRISAALRYADVKAQIDAQAGPEAIFAALCAMEDAAPPRP